MAFLCRGWFSFLQWITWSYVSSPGGSARHMEGSTCCRTGAVVLRTFIQTRHMTGLHAESTVPLSTRAQSIEPFYAVAIFREAMELAEKGRAMILSVGEPDFPTPPNVI